MSAATVLTIYCAAIVVASLVGGYLPLLIRLTHRRLEIAISFVAGVILGVGMLHLLPHAIEVSDDVEWVMGWTLGGFLLMFFLDRFFHFHHHDAPGDVPCDAPGHAQHELHHHEHDHRDHAHAAHGESPDVAPRLSHATFSWSGAAVGLTMHSLIEGLAFAAGVAAELREDAAMRWAGLGIFLAVFLHKPFDSLTVGTLMAASGRPVWYRHAVNVLLALAVPGGVFVYWLSAGSAMTQNSQALGVALAFAAGAFICIASSDLLPELQFHSHDRVKLSAALVCGVALAVGIVALEHSSHHHAHAAHRAGCRTTCTRIRSWEISPVGGMPAPRGHGRASRQPTNRTLAASCQWHTPKSAWHRPHSPALAVQTSSPRSARIRRTSAKISSMRT